MIVAIIQARMNSSRLPNKTLIDISGKPMLQRVIDRVSRAALVDRVVVATSGMADDEPIQRMVASENLFMGSKNDVLDRVYKAAIKHDAHIVVRITGDCPLIDWNIINGVVHYFLLTEVDYVTNRPLFDSYPDGMDVEVMTIEALKRVWKEATSSYDREHVTSYIRNHPELFKIGEMTYDADLSHIKVSVDTQEDLEIVRRIYRDLGEYAELAGIVFWWEHYRNG